MLVFDDKHDEISGIALDSCNTDIGLLPFVYVGTLLAIYLGLLKLMNLGLFICWNFNHAMEVGKMCGTSERDCVKRVVSQKGCSRKRATQFSQESTTTLSLMQATKNLKATHHTQH